MRRSPAQTLRRVATLATVNRVQAGTGTEATSRATEGTEASVSIAAVGESVSALADHLARLRGGISQLTDEDQKLLETSRRAGTKLVSEGAAAYLSRSEEIALEAIAAADGSRPALLLRNDEFDPHDPTI